LVVFKGVLFLLKNLRIAAGFLNYYFKHLIIINALIFFACS